MGAADAHPTPRGGARRLEEPSLLLRLGQQRVRRHTMAFGLGYALLCNIGAPVVHFAAGASVAYWEDPVPLLAHILGLVSLASFFIARQGEHNHAAVRHAARLLVWGAFAIIWLAVLATLGTAYERWIPFYLAVPPLLGGFILEWRQVALVGAFNVLGTVTLGAVDLLDHAIAANAAILAVAVTIVVATNAHLRIHDQTIIGTQAGLLLARAHDLEDVVRTAPYALASLDHEGRLVLWNSLLDDLVDEPARLVPHARLDPVLAPALGIQLDSLLSPGIHKEADVALPDGRALTVEAAPMAAGGWVVRIQDVTHRRAAEEQERERFQQEVELGKLREMNDFKTHLLNTASHELNTPLTPIRLQLELLRSTARGPLNAKQVHSLEILDRNTRRLDALVRDILDVAKMESDRLRLKLEPVALGTLLRDEVTSFQDPASRAGLHLSCDAEDVWVMGDPLRLAQVVANLIGNAVKFTPAGGHITVGCAGEADVVRAWVHDTGIGIPPDRRDELFQPFVQLHDESRAYGGTGLGLYIVKGIVEAHGGTIGAQSQSSGGTTFWFTLPLVDDGQLAEAGRVARGSVL